MLRTPLSLDQYPAAAPLSEGGPESAPQMPTHDALTGLNNRQWLDEHLPTMLHEEAGDVGIIFLDADDLRAINNTHGHEAGNRMLQTVADTLRGVVRSEEQADGDTSCRAADVVRYAGDEFVVTLRGIRTQEDVNMVTTRAHAALVESGVSVSAGGLMYNGGSVEEFLTQASILMRENKEKHKLDKYPSPAQQAAAEQIGAIAAEHGIELRDVPTLLSALHRQGA